MVSPSRSRSPASSASQRGVVLFVALIVLVIMTLAGLTLMRQMGAGNAIAGNVAFKESATSAADAGIEQARAWILANTPLLNGDQLAVGYYNTWAAGIDPTQFDWSRSGTTALESAGTTGNSVRFIIQRLCEFTGLDPGDPTQRCSVSPVTDPRTHGGITYGDPGTDAAPTKPFYRITARVDGARNTISYTQVLIY